MGIFPDSDNIWVNGRVPLMCSAHVTLTREDGAGVDLRSLSGQAASREIRIAVQYGWVVVDASRGGDIDECAEFLREFANGVGAISAKRGSGSHPIALDGYFEENSFEDVAENLESGHMLEFPCLQGWPRRSGEVGDARDLAAIERRVVSTAMRAAIALGAGLSERKPWLGVEFELFEPEKIKLLGIIPFELITSSHGWMLYSRAVAALIARRDLSEDLVETAGKTSTSVKSKSL
jgi:hypothetical protein